MTRVLVTGASGFVGTALCPMLTQAGYVVRAAVHRRSAPAGVVETAAVGEIGARTSWTEALAGVDVVVHMAARVHILNETATAETLYEETNVQGTRRLAAEAARAGVSRLVFLSSIKVNGERTSGAPFTAADEPQPQDAYGRSKRDAERALWEAIAGTPMQGAVVRPPLVYGPEVRANFLRLLNWSDRGLPLPFGAIRNRRSLVSVWNLSDLLVRVLAHPAAAGRVWMVSDGEDLSTAELVTRISAAMGRGVNLIGVPVAVLRAIACLVGKTPEIERLCGSLYADVAPTCRELDWSPPLSVDEGLARTVGWYRSTRNAVPAP